MISKNVLAGSLVAGRGLRLIPHLGRFSMGTSLGAAKMKFCGGFVRVSLVVLFCLAIVNVLEGFNLSCPKVDLQQVSVCSSGNGGTQRYLWQLGH